MMMQNNNEGYRRTGLGAMCSGLVMAGMLAASGAAFAGGHDSGQGFLTDTRGNEVRSGFGLCWGVTWETGTQPPACLDEPEPEPEPAPEPEPEPELERISVDSEALFGFDSDELSPGGRANLRNVIERINAMERVDSIRVNGHTDHIGSAAYNQELSERRAAAVRTFMVQQGVDDNLITSRGYGEDRPVKECPDNLSGSALIECLAPNRRVEIHVEGVR
ncbi:OmpA family protein [Alkalilimnicola ehrlichii]|uniref:OmpA family protein n=1 Tax=Alkalilimnicola ehrlichii TaxID=351052 RepID=UPI003BA374D2